MCGGFFVNSLHFCWTLNYAIYMIHFKQYIYVTVEISIFGLKISYFDILQDTDGNCMVLVKH